jgi:hypothetical protein
MVALSVLVVLEVEPPAKGGEKSTMEVDVGTLAACRCRGSTVSASQRLLFTCCNLLFRQCPVIASDVMLSGRQPHVTGLGLETVGDFCLLLWCPEFTCLGGSYCGHLPGVLHFSKSLIFLTMQPPGCPSSVLSSRRPYVIGLGFET